MKTAKQFDLGIGLLRGMARGCGIEKVVIIEFGCVGDGFTPGRSAVVKVVTSRIFEEKARRVAIFVE